MKLKLLSATLLCSLFFGTQGKPISGYLDKDGNYKWFNEHTDSSFIDEIGHRWTKIANNKDKWNKAIIIRNANICALLDLGFDTLKVLKDVQLLNENSILYTHFSRLDNYKSYIFYWQNSFNSSAFNFKARKSSKISKTDLALKFYYNKASVNNATALGLVKQGLISHISEASLELLKNLKFKVNKLAIEKYIKNYMHLNNAIELLNEKKLQNDLILEKILNK